ncbi:Flp family type IVb pilin [Solirhodobacter olei]|uniref:Flp family type IVb pilin n=1 Tax=Solirhodobacter olei TaxID=2493082 RepID=UPI000FD8DC56|nr:hypothetical protein [Solirhodobacter olei]
MRKLASFLRDDDGAVTVDWVVLTALICSLCGLVFYILGYAPVNLATQIGGVISSVKIVP